jgi:hypothetical protein
VHRAQSMGPNPSSLSIYQRNTSIALPPGKRPGTLCIGGWVGPGLAWTGAENLATTGIQSPDLPARSESVYRLSYPGPSLLQNNIVSLTLNT